MDKYQLFRLVVLLCSVVGFILCFVSLVIPNWIDFTTAAVSGYQGLFITCIDQHGGGTICAKLLDYNIDGSYKASQVLMCIGFSFYFIFVVLATMTFFWTNKWTKKRALKLSAAASALLAAVLLLTTVIIFEKRRVQETETLSYGWYLAVISLVFVMLACPCLVIDTLKTKQKKADITKSMNVAPRPTALSVYQRQKLIDGFSAQMYEKGQLPIPLGLKQKMPKLYDVTPGSQSPPRAITPTGSDTDLEAINIIKTPMLPPPFSEYKFKSMYDDEDFVHPPPHIISSNVTLKDILKRNLKPAPGYDSETSSIRSGHYSLESGQLDDSDLEIHLLTKGSVSNNESEDDRSRSREAFPKKRVKKKHKIASKTMGNKNVTEIEHEGLPTIRVIAPDTDNHSEYNGSRRSSKVAPMEKGISDHDTHGEYNGSRRSSKVAPMEQSISDNDIHGEYHGSRRSSKVSGMEDNVSQPEELNLNVPFEIQTDQNIQSGPQSPINEVKAEKRPSKKRSKKQKKKHTTDKSDKTLLVPDHDINQEHKVLDKETFVAIQRGTTPVSPNVTDDVIRETENNKSSIHDSSVKGEDGDECLGRRHPSKKKKKKKKRAQNEEENKTKDETVDKKEKNENDGEMVNELKTDDDRLTRSRHSRKKKRKEKMNENLDEVGWKQRSTEEDYTFKRSSSKKKKHKKPYVGDDLTYDPIGDADTYHARDREETPASLRKDINEILKIPVKDDDKITNTKL